MQGIDGPAQTHDLKRRESSMLTGVQVDDLLGEDSDGEVEADTTCHAFYSSDAFPAFTPVSSGPPGSPQKPTLAGRDTAAPGRLNTSRLTVDMGGSGGARARSLTLSLPTSTPPKVKRVCALEMPPPQLKKILSEESGSLRGLASMVCVLNSTLFSDFLRHMYQGTDF
jgi:hypothetical protein